MQLPLDALIAQEKLTQYLLVFLPKDDKSQFLLQAGYDLDNWRKLEYDIRQQILTQSAHFLEKTPYGDKYQIDAVLKGVNGRTLKVTTIWMITDRQTKFVTLVPRHDN